MTVPTRSTKSVAAPQPTRVTRAVARAASTRADSSPKETRGKAGAPRPRVEKTMLGPSPVTRSKVRVKGDSPLGLEDVVMDLMQPQAQLWDDDIPVRLLD